MSTNEKTTMENIIAYRIISARKLKGLSQQEIADAIGVSKQMISKYEKGTAIPSSPKLIQLAQLFGQKVDYFFRSFQIELGALNFRKRSSFSMKKQHALKEQIKISLENYLWVEEVLSIDGVFKNIIQDNKINNYNDIESVVLKLRTSWNIGLDPIHNIIQVLEDKEIKVIELDDVDDKFDGLATYIDNKYPVIVVNGNFRVERKRFTLLHELGHLLLNLPNEETDQVEKFCNKFASEFLFPRHLVLAEFGGKRSHVTLPELISIQKKYGISIPAIIFSLVEAGVLSKEYQVQFYKKINFDSNLKIEVNQSRFATPEKSSRYEQLIYRALAQECISMSKASSLLNKDIEVVKKAYTSL